MSEAEAVFMKLMAEGVFSIDEKGRIWRHRRLVRGSGSTKHAAFMVWKDVPAKRADNAFTGQYRCIYPCDLLGGRGLQARAHRVVWMAFNDSDIPPRMEINHINGVRDDNRPENLEVVTGSGNQLHSYLVLGRVPVSFPGALHPMVKLTEAEVLEIRAIGASLPQSEIGRIYGIEQSNVSAILRRKIWSELPQPKQVTISTGAQNLISNSRAQHPLPGPRIKRGQDRAFAKLTERQVLEIRALGGVMAQAGIAECYGICQKTVSSILHRHTWKHLK